MRVQSHLVVAFHTQNVPGDCIQYIRVTHVFSACAHIYIKISCKRKPQCETVHTVSCAAEVFVSQCLFDEG